MAKTKAKRERRRLLKHREGDIGRGVPVTPRLNRCTIDELFDDVVTDYRVNGKRSLGIIKRSFDKHLRPYFTGRKAAAISTADVRSYIDQRQSAGARNSTINRELTALKRAFRLGAQAAKVLVRPHIAMLREDNVRRGFFEPEQFEAVRRQLPPALQAVVTFAYLTGWRVRSEVQPLQWRQVDFDGGTVRLDAGTTKNGEGRVFPMTVELRTLLEEQRAHADRVQRERGVIVPHVFHRDGCPIRSFYKAWRNACTAAGCPDNILHDFRRTAVRNLVRAVIPERVAMQMTGHKTRAVFERYNIVSEGDLTEAARKLDDVAGTITGTIAATGAAAPRRRRRN